MKRHEGDEAFCSGMPPSLSAKQQKYIIDNIYRTHICILDTSMHNKT